MPKTVEERVAVGTELVAKLVEAGVGPERVLVDPLAQPVSVDTRMAVAALEAMEAVREARPGIRPVLGLSNISFGLPERALINRTFLALALGRGLEAAILDPTDRPLMATLTAAEMLLDRDPYCERYIEAWQEGRLSGPAGAAGPGGETETQ
jgi:5-methyltetrahydrofolate--homocysteine methyltransferase